MTKQDSLNNIAAMLEHDLAEAYGTKDVGFALVVSELQPKEGDVSADYLSNLTRVSAKDLLNKTVALLGEDE